MSVSDLMMTRNLANSSAAREIVIEQSAEQNLPTIGAIRRWVELAAEDSCGDVFVRFVDRKESQRLNRQFRGIDRPTNVLAFPANHTGLLGDVALCFEVAKVQARSQGKDLSAHVAHLIVHGVLHLRGFDHVGVSDTWKMEQLEIALLEQIGVANPYE